MIRDSSCRHDVECTTTGSSGYHFSTSSTTCAGCALTGSPTRSEAACRGFIQNNPVSRRVTGRTSSVWATKSGDHGVVLTGGPMVSMRASSRGLLLRAITLDRPPDRPDVRGREGLLVHGPAMILDAGDDLRLRAAGRPAAAAGDLHLHAERLPRGRVRCA